MDSYRLYLWQDLFCKAYFGLKSQLQTLLLFCYHRHSSGKEYNYDLVFTTRIHPVKNPDNKKHLFCSAKCHLILIVSK